MTANFSLSGPHRAAVRKALTSAAGWPDYRSAHNLRIDQMNAESLIRACADMGINIAAIVGDETQTETEMTPAEIPATEEKPDMKADKTHSPVAGDKAAQLAALIAELAGTNSAPVDLSQVNAAIDERMKKILESVADTAAAVCTRALEQTEQVVITIKQDGREPRNVTGHKHPQFATLLRAVSCRMANGFAPCIWLSGPAGSGKTHAGHQLADTLGFQFYLNGAISMPHELLGFIDAAGNYHRTPFRDAYENGGVYMFDEVDGSDNSALLALNAALANGFATFPDARVPRHKDCIIIASANTFGLGATADYVGRAKIDAAFLSRFPVRVSWQYDTKLEIAISGNESFAQRVQAARSAAKRAGIKVVIDPRASQAGAALIEAGFSEDEAAKLTYLANLTPEQRKQIEGESAAA